MGRSWFVCCGGKTDLPSLDKSEFRELTDLKRLVVLDVDVDVMARSLYSISPSPGPLSPSLSDDSSSLDGAPSNYTDLHDGAQPTASRPGSPTRRGQPANAAPPPDMVTCQWEDCGAAFDDLNTFIRHLHEGAAGLCPTRPLSLATSFRRSALTFFMTSADHIGVHKSNYTCEWATCTRRGLPQTSRFALISHLRSHTGEKPFTCELPGTHAFSALTTCSVDPIPTMQCDP